MMTLRNTLFWSVDRMKRNVIRSHIEDIRQINENYLSPASIRRREQLLRELLDHATSTTKFYKKYKGKPLSEFPVINKNVIRNQAADFRSDCRTTFPRKEVVTSGSTGIHLSIDQDRRKQQRNTADTIYYLQKARYIVGSELIYIRKWEGLLRKPLFIAWLQNVKMIEVTDLDDAYIDRLIRYIERNKSPKGILSYASALTQIGKYLEQHQRKVDGNVTTIIGASESLTPYTKQTLERYFGIPVISRYSNMENGILAQQFPDDGSDFHINSAGYILEVFDMEEDVAVGYGVPGRIMITDLFSYATPLIRYDIGDVGIIDLNDQGVPVLKELHGRQMDMIFDTRGNMIAPTVVFELYGIKEIKQLQLIQTGQTSYTLKLNVEKSFNSDEEVINRFKKYFGSDADITIEKTDEVPLLSSGKRKLVSNIFKS